MIGIIDYGAGNLRSVQNTLAEIGAPYRLVHTAEQLYAASKVILPGVGHFGQMMRALEMMEMRDPIKKIIGNKVPFLGICLGMQAMYERSAEAPELEGFSVLPGEIKRFSNHSLRVPHMGWNEITPRPGGPATAATCHYGEDYTAVIESENLFGVQFHPEKSGPLGLCIVKNFISL
jgi:glutamine amidotransferase